MLSNLWLLLLMIAKVALLTGFAPGIAILFLLKKLLRVGPEYDATLCHPGTYRRRPALISRKAA
jgi:hypothetical protein